MPRNGLVCQVLQALYLVAGVLKFLEGSGGYVGRADDSRKILKISIIFNDFGDTGPACRFPIYCAQTSSNDGCAYESSYVNSWAY